MDAVCSVRVLLGENTRSRLHAVSQMLGCSFAEALSRGCARGLRVVVDELSSAPAETHLNLDPTCLGESAVVEVETELPVSMYYELDRLGRRFSRRWEEFVPLCVWTGLPWVEAEVPGAEAKQAAVYRAEQAQALDRRSRFWHENDDPNLN